jgi:hypothetical protein
VSRCAQCGGRPALKLYRPHLHFQENRVTGISIDKRVNDFLAAEGRLVIGGQRHMALCSKTFDTPNPATGRRLATVAEGQAEDIDCRGQSRPGGLQRPLELADTLATGQDLVEDR